MKFLREVPFVMSEDNQANSHKVSAGSQEDITYRIWEVCWEMLVLHPVVSEVLEYIGRCFL